MAQKEEKPTIEEIYELVEEGLEMSPHPFVKTTSINYLLEERGKELSRTTILNYLHQLEEEDRIVKADVTDNAFIWYIEE